MTSHQTSETDHNFVIAVSNIKQPTECHTASHDVTSLISQPNYSANKNKNYIVQMNSEPVVANSNKLKSLLPKNMLKMIPKSEPDTYLFQVSNESHIQTDNKFSQFIPGEIIVSQPCDDKGTQAITFATPVVTTEVIENILQQFHSSIASTGVSESESRISHCDAEQELDKTSSFTIEAVEGTLSDVVRASQLSSDDVHATWSHDIGTSLPLTSQVLPDEIDKEQDIIKKTVVEAFVKMVVCRKLTVQKVHAKTGQILDTKVKTEEEEPVILGVDCVETTEDLISSSVAELATASNCNTDTVTSKWGTSLDGGLKFLSAVSESRQKIGKSIIKDKVFRSSPQKGISLARLTELEACSSTQVDASKHKFFVESTPNASSVQIKTEPKTDSDSDWNEEVNDDSVDYVPGASKVNFIKSTVSTRHQNGKKAYKNPNNKHMTQSCVNDSPIISFDTDVLVLRQKKRGRKRKWDNALGMASNLKICQFCNKHFSSSQACGKHMKKGDCVSSVFCYICSKPFQNEHLLDNHLLMHGSEVKSGAFECRDCNRSYRTRAGYMKHFRMGTCSKRDDYEDGCTGEFNCDLCESRFSSEGYLKLHRYKVHENPKDTHTCSDCGKRFYSIQGYNKHRQGRPCTEPLRCHICGKSYSSKAKESFKIHMKHHRTEVNGITFQCDECERSYMTQMALNKHKLSHTGVKPYKCNVCGKEFSMRYMVKDHARMHTGERPFHCSLCGGAFSNKGHLGRHLRSHENGTLMKRGRPKKIRKPDGTELKMIEFGQTLHNFDGQTIQVVDGQMFESQTSGTPMIIQANNNTIIITEGWPNACTASTITLPSSQSIAMLQQTYMPPMGLKSELVYHVDIEICNFSKSY
uniref:C2H2-type domain-containing protein n=1 Tax=Arion vulgaris TaxID=1028688 RepID=A0A0B7AA16_9EUPU